MLDQKIDKTCGHTIWEKLFYAFSTVLFLLSIFLTSLYLDIPNYKSLNHLYVIFAKTLYILSSFCARYNRWKFSMSRLSFFHFLHSNLFQYILNERRKLLFVSRCTCVYTSVDMKQSTFLQTFKTQLWVKIVFKQSK